jgi:hypothetical protein
MIEPKGIEPKGIEPKDIEPKDVVEIRTPEVDVEEIMEKIRGRVHQRRATALSQGLDYDRLTNTSSSHATGRQLQSNFYYDLNQARQSADSIWVSLSVVGNSRYPEVISSFVTRVRQSLHQMVIYYVNMLAGRQVNYNRATIDAVTGLAEAHEAAIERLEALEKEVAALREQLAQSTKKA